jgi:hypothetical protein
MRSLLALILPTLFISIIAWANTDKPRKSLAYGVILKLQSIEKIENNTFDKLIKQYGLQKFQFYSGVNFLTLKLKKPSYDIQILTNFCKEVIAKNGVENCELDLKLEPMLFAEATCNPNRNNLLPEYLKVLEIINQDCKLFKELNSYDIRSERKLMDGLSNYWAQEYTGADLLRERLNALDPKLIPPPNFIGVWDSRYGEHGTMVSNLIIGNKSTALIPSQHTIGYTDLTSTADYLDAYQAAFDQCRSSNSCPHYINNSMAWTIGNTIPSVIKTLVKETGAVFVVASGNANSIVNADMNQSAQDDDIILVASHGPTGEPSQFTNYSSALTISAPSDDHILSHSSNSYEIFGGTSGAAPQVTGTLAAFELIAGYKLSNKESKRLLEKTALPSLHLPVPNETGHGLLNTYLIGDIAFRLKEKCRGDKQCVQNSLSDDSTFTREKSVTLLDNLKDFFPSCSGREIDREIISVKSCEEKSDYFKMLRQKAFISDSPEAWKAIFLNDFLEVMMISLNLSLIMMMILNIFFLPRHGIILTRKKNY